MLVTHGERSGVVGLGTGVSAFQSVGKCLLYSLILNGINFTSDMELFSERPCHLFYVEGTVILTYNWLAFADTGSLGPGSRDTVGRVIPSGRPHLQSPGLSFHERSVECPWEDGANGWGGSLCSGLAVATSALGPTV